MTPQAFIIPARADPDAIEAARPTGIAPGDRCRSELLASPWAVGTDAANTVVDPVPEARPATWWQPIVDGLRHAWYAHELCDTWTRDDLADAIADALWTEARLLTQETEERVTVPSAAVAAVARIRRGE